MSTLDTIECGHEPKMARGMCKRCYSTWHMRNWRAANRDRVNETARRWRRNHPDRQSKYDRKSKLLRKYGTSIEEYNEILSQQEGKCAMAGCVREATVVDHDHKSGMFRGLLCTQHNTGLGFFQVDIYKLL